MIRGKIEAVTGRSKSKDKQNKVFITIVFIFLSRSCLIEFTWCFKKGLFGAGTRIGCHCGIGFSY